MNRLTLKNINKQFKDNTIFENINLELESLKIYGLIGPNGFEKSVLFQIMCGLSLPTHEGGTYNDMQLRTFHPQLALLLMHLNYIHN